MISVEQPTPAGVNSELFEPALVVPHKKLTILHVGPFWDGSTSLWRHETLKHFGHNILSLDITPFEQSGHRILQSLRHRLYWGPGVGPLNRRFLDVAQQTQPDIIWVERGLFIKPHTVRQIRKLTGAVLINYNTDDPFGLVKNGWRLFKKSIPEYDMHFVSRDQNLQEYRIHGAKRVARFEWAYHSAIHSPQPVSPMDRERLGGEIGFIGDYELERASWMHFLAVNGCKIRVWGPNWHRCRFKHPNLKLECRPVWAKDYAQAVNAFDINLGFLRKANRDLSTQRSVEIPACGGFFLGERTTDHLRLFNEGSEAEFFDTKEELLGKVRYYLEHSEERKTIASQGRARCISGGYSYHDRLADTLKRILHEFSIG